MTSVGDRIGCVTVLEVMEAAVAIERDLRGYRGKPAHPAAKGAHVWVRCDCLLEFLVRARELSRRKSAERCGEKCELGKHERKAADMQEWTRCRSPLCQAELRADNRSGFCKTCRYRYPGRRWYLMTLPGFIEHRRKYLKNYRKKQAKRGVCVRCCSRLAEGTKCARCKAYSQAYKPARRRRLSRLGLCEQCGLKESQKNRRRCKACLAFQREWKARSLLKKADEARKVAA